MEDKTVRSSEEFLKEVSELNLDELENIAGGRECTDKEDEDFETNRWNTVARIRELWAEGREEDARRLSQALPEAEHEWSETLRTAPDGSEVLMSEIMKKYWI